MKTLLFIFFLAICSVQAQTTAHVPVNMYIDVPLLPVTNITIVTNVYYITVTNSPTGLTMLTSDRVDATLGPRLVSIVKSPPTFVFTNFTSGLFSTLYIQNPGAFPMTFQKQNVLWFGPIPTNQVRGAILIEAVGTELWCTPVMTPPQLIN
jgi:hypothetical protein